MWPIIFLVTFTYVFGTAIKPLDRFEVPLWRERVLEAVLTDENVDSQNYEISQKRLLLENVDSSGLNLDVVVRPSSNKRALAIFNRWGTIAGIGKNRPPIRSHYDVNDFISAQPRARTLGQPLRWG